MKLPEISNKAKNIITTGGLIIILIPFIVGAICKAYEAYLLSSLESALTQNIAALSNAKKACNASYEALKAYKIEAKVPLSGTGNPCEGF